LAMGTVTTFTQQADFQRPYGMAYGADGVLYVDTDYDPDGEKNPGSGTIWRINATSGTATVVAADIGRPRGVAAAHDRRLILGDYQNARVLVLVPGGAVSNLVSDTCARGANERAFAVPYGVAILPDGRAVVADQDAHRLSVVDGNGGVMVYAGGGGMGTID